MRKERVYYIKPFTKAWFFNIWFHYKVLIIISAIFVFLFGFFIFEKLAQVRYDFSMYYIGDTVDMFPGENDPVEKFEKALEGAIPDFNNNGKTQVICEGIFVSNDLAMTNSGVKTDMEKAEMMMRAGESSVFLFGGGYEEPYVGDGTEEALYDLTSLAKKYNYPDEALKKYPDGRVYAINMKDNPLMEFDASNVCIVVRPLLDEIKKAKDNYANELKVAEYIISRGTYNFK